MEEGPVPKTLVQIDAEVAAKDGRDVPGLLDWHKEERKHAFPAAQRKEQTATNKALARIDNTILIYVYTKVNK